MSIFQKATKRQLKGRLALAGPTGSGKTWTALEWATVLGKRIALIDTERSSASLYSDRFDFDVLDMQPPFEPERLVQALKVAEAEGYDVIVVDSLSHYWEGEGGVLDIVDGAAQRAHGNSFAGWKVGTPALRHLVDTLLGIDAHLIITMRSKMEYVLETDSRGKQVPKKIGMAPVMRAGVEYEFTLIGDMDLEHRITISKSRCDALSDAMIPAGRAAEPAQTFKAWLDSGEPMASRNDIDAIRSMVKGIGDLERRNECARLFKDRFGPVENLPASKVAEAIQFVASHEGVLADAPPVVPAEDQRSGAAPPPADPKGLVNDRRARAIHIEAGELAKTLGHVNSKGNGESKWADAVLDALVLAVTGGRTASTKELTVAEDDRLGVRMAELADGRAVAAVSDDFAAVSLHHGEQVLRFIRNDDGAMVHLPAINEGESR